MDGDNFGGTGLGGAELFLRVGGSGLFGLKRDTKSNSCHLTLQLYVLTVQVVS